MIRRPPRSTHCISSAASDVYKRQVYYAILLLPPDLPISYEVVYLNEAKTGEILSERRKQSTITVSSRVGEVRDPSTRAEQKLERRFAKAESVFANWQVDTKDSLRRMVWNDYARTKIAKCTSSQHEAKELLNEIYKSAEKIRDLYAFLAIRSVYPCISRFHFNSFCKKKNILDKVCTLSDLDRFFIAISLNAEKIAVSNTCVERNLARCEFLEILVRMANRKYKETCLLYTSPSPRDLSTSRMPSSACKKKKKKTKNKK
eukprot:TRINITY_DN13552_c0_g1_i1.p1 TRINITY_DN13552_c0_g1~~TRINITY_DN13552_c0_g1_i1.p1  ORF type:complete len:268 (-),score=56.46 TRINITY_DN13552_c0_g1_i1:25-804(-)